MKTKNNMKIIFCIVLLLTLFVGPARADQAPRAPESEEMSQEDQEILAALNEDLTVTLKPVNRK